MHGLGGGPKDTWTYRASQTDHRFWPDWLLKDIPGLAAYTVSYPADKMGWNKGWPIEQAAVAVSKALQTEDSLRAAGTPIVFVCHSLGGIIVKKLILKANSVREVDTPTGIFLDRIAGVVFLATPHDGSTLATIVSKFGWLVSDTMKDLVANSARLGDISNDYRNYVAANNNRIRHEVYYENDSVDIEKPISSFTAKLLGQKGGNVVGFIAGKLMGGAVGKVVTSGSANPGLPGPDPVPVCRDHINICKVADTTDEVYKGVRTFLRGALELRPAGTLADQHASKVAREALKALHDLDNAIRKTIGPLTRFDMNWRDDQRRQALADMQMLADTEVILPEVRRLVAELEHRLAETAGLSSAVQAAATTILNCGRTALTALGRSEVTPWPGPFDLAVLLNKVGSATTDEEAKFVSGQAGKVLTIVDRQALAEADVLVGGLP